MIKSFEIALFPVTATPFPFLFLLSLPSDQKQTVDQLITWDQQLRYLQWDDGDRAGTTTTIVVVNTDRRKYNDQKSQEYRVASKMENE